MKKKYHQIKDDLLEKRATVEWQILLRLFLLSEWARRIDEHGDL